MEMYRQGDLLFIKTSDIPILENKVQEKIILKSNVTGHSHSITKGILYKQEPDSQSVFCYIDCPEGTELLHQEHKTINLPEGIYEVRRQREVSGYVRD